MPPDNSLVVEGRARDHGREQAQRVECQVIPRRRLDGEGDGDPVTDPEGSAGAGAAGYRRDVDDNSRESLTRGFLGGSLVDDRFPW